ncbi:MAG: hypothetical protein ACJ72Q_21450 [Nitrososphaeraceae archaeon]
MMGTLDKEATSYNDIFDAFIHTSAYTIIIGMERDCKSVCRSDQCTAIG